MREGEKNPYFKGLWSIGIFCKHHTSIFRGRVALMILMTNMSYSRALQRVNLSLDN